MNNIIIPICFVPPIPILAACLRNDKIIVDGGENYVKQTIRNRYHILSANGVLSLTANVISQKGEKIPTGKIQFDYEKKWVRQHLRAIESAYRSAPFFEHYFPEIRKIIATPYKHMEEMFLQCFPKWLKLCGIEVSWKYNSSFVETKTTTDFRLKIKHPEDFITPITTANYVQVFSDRFPFVPNLSIIDLLMNEGPAARVYLKKQGE